MGESFLFPHPSENPVSLCSTAFGAGYFPLPPRSLCTERPKGSHRKQQRQCRPKPRLGVVQQHLSGGSGKPWRKGEKGGRFRGIPSWKKHESEEKGLSPGFQDRQQRSSWHGSRRDAWGGRLAPVAHGQRVPPQRAGRGSGGELAERLLGIAALGERATGGRVGGQAMSFVVTVMKTSFLMAGMRWARCKRPKQKQPGEGRKGVR